MFKHMPDSDQVERPIRLLDVLDKTDLDIQPVLLPGIISIAFVRLYPVDIVTQRLQQVRKLSTASPYVENF
jgi:hypothetical protein